MRRKLEPFESWQADWRGMRPSRMPETARGRLLFAVYCLIVWGLLAYGTFAAFT